MEGNNVKAMSEALAEIVFITMKVGMSIKADVACGIIAAKAKHALKTPPRNCDVGTAEEQDNRMDVYCQSRKCEICPLWDNANNGVRCEFTWAQMQYEEGGAK